MAKLVIRARLKIGCPSGLLGSTPSPGIGLYKPILAGKRVTRRWLAPGTLSNLQAMARGDQRRLCFRSFWTLEAYALSKSVVKIDNNRLVLDNYRPSRSRPDFVLCPAAESTISARKIECRSLGT